MTISPLPWEENDPAAWVDALSDREALVMGAGICMYQAGKTAPRPSRANLRLVHDAPAPILLFLRMVRLMGAERSALRYRLTVGRPSHADEAARWWADLVGVQAALIQRRVRNSRPALAARREIGGLDRGLFAVEVLDSGALYLKVDGIVREILGTIVDREERPDDRG
jgi:hypothetical protein